MTITSLSVLPGTALVAGTALPAGPVGPAGAVGPAGPQGALGQSGLQGVAGAAGPSGATGAPGGTAPAPSFIQNGAFDVWSRGADVLSHATNGAVTNSLGKVVSAGRFYSGADRHMAVPTGAAITTQQVANGRSGALTRFALKISGASGATDVTYKQRIESYDAAKLSGQTIVYQAYLTNNTGSTLTPTIWAKHASSADNFGSVVAETGNGTDMQEVTDTSTVLLGFAITCSSDVVNGLEIGIDFGTALGTTGHTVTIAEVDLQIVPGTSAPDLATPPMPNFPMIAETKRICERYCETSYGDGVPMGTITALGQAFISVTDTTAGELSTPTAGTSVQFRQMKAGVPTVLLFSPTSGVVGRVHDSNYGEQATTATNIGTGNFSVAPGALGANAAVKTWHWLAYFDL